MNNKSRVKIWRFVDTGPCAAFYNMAIDDAIAHFVRNGESPPTLRLYGWKGPSVSLGSFQKITDINLQYCKSNGISVVRRPTGGRAILHGEELTYSFSSRNEEPFSDSLMETYYLLSVVLQKAFTSAGLQTTMKQERESGRTLAHSPICFRSTSYGEITFDGRKIIGSAQKRWNNSFMQQGSIPFAIDEAGINNIFNIAKHDLKDNQAYGLRDILPGLSIQGLKDGIRLSFEKVFNIRFLDSSLSREEHLLAQELEVRKYQRPEWNLERQASLREERLYQQDLLSRSNSSKKISSL